MFVVSLDSPLISIVNLGREEEEVASLTSLLFSFSIYVDYLFISVYLYITRQLSECYVFPVYNFYHSNHVLNLSPSCSTSLIVRDDIAVSSTC